MRGNWQTVEPHELTTVEHHDQFQHQHQLLQQQMFSNNNQQQQQQSVYHQNYPQQNVTCTPDWDRLPVKEEYLEDKNNDSGLSPGFDTSNSGSPHSHRSSTTLICSLSPTSTASHDSNGMHDYQQQNYDQISSTQPESKDCKNNETMETKEQDEITSDFNSCNLLVCPVCPFRTSNKLEFTQHLAIHCNSNKIDQNEFTKAVMDQLQNSNGNLDGSRNTSSPSQFDNDEENMPDGADEQLLGVPRVTSQGKVKTLRCKQCQFIAITKLDFWEHTRVHIKSEKILTCSKCPFVTEYKHHLEYHLRNHYGSKPYRCDKCSYSCVNKSMLNSHLKSHSSVYQFRCLDCSYATKYCHSLKLHLRKYKHKPAEVLDSNGVPNPLPIIDVYGTRRGPKTKQQKKNSSTASPQIPVPLLTPPQFNGIENLPKVNELAGIMNDISNPVSTPSLNMIGYPFSQIFPAFGIQNNLNIPTELNEDQLNHIKSNILEYVKTINQNEDKQNELSTQSNESAPLDLSKTIFPSDKTKNDQKTSSLNNNKVSSRRKGKAVKLNHRIMQADSDDDAIMNLSSPASSLGSTDSAEANKETQVEYMTPQNVKKEIVEVEKVQSKLTESSKDIILNKRYNCNYCQISFGNEFMHVAHMGYHGFDNPFKCNMCGVMYDDSLSFFLHIARVQH